MFISTYSYKFFRHVEKFMQLHGLFPSSGKLLVACSTGVDSMVLLLFAEHLLERGLINSIEVVHVNHGTRSACENEEEFLRDYCHKRQMTLHVKRLKGPVTSNFEAWAREERYRFFTTLIKKGDRLATAHHLDDSFEWWLLQNLKNSNTKILGIPVQRQSFIRPFLCVTKKHIETLALKNDLNYFTDQSNLNLRYERNYLREEVIGRMGHRFPKYLKHYAHRSNIKALELSQTNKNVRHQIIENNNFGIHVLFTQVPSVMELSEWIKKVSNKEKGSVRQEILKLLRSLESGGQGPMDFSGGVKIFFNRSELLVVNLEKIKNYRKLDQKMKNNLAQGSLPLVTKSLGELLQDYFPFPRFFVTEDSWVLQAASSSKKIHPLFPESTSFLIENNLWFCSANQLKQLCLKRSEFFEKLITIINLHPMGDPA